MAELKNPRALGLKDLCSYLGYEHRSNLISTLDSYVADYEARYAPIPPTQKANLQRAQECALDFLCEEDRGETFWPPTSRNKLEWPRNQRDITLAVAHIIQRRAFYHYLKRKRIEKAEVFGAIQNKTTAWEKRQKRHRSPSPPSSSGDDSEFEDEPFGANSEFILESWKQPAKRFSRKRCLQYLMLLNPRDDDGDLKAFTVEWLNKDKGRYSWPQSADRRLQMFMHERNCYLSEPLSKTDLREIIDYVTRGTELAHGITRLQHKELQLRVELRMEFYTKHLSRMRFLDSKTDATPKQTVRFRYTFNNLVRHWSENVYAVPDSPDRGDIRPKKRKKGRPAKSQLPSSPVLFPNLVREDSDVPWLAAASNTDSARDTTTQQDTASQRSRMQLASIAASALGVANRQEEEEEEEQGEEEEGEGEDKDDDDRAHAANIQDLAALLSEPEPLSACPSTPCTSPISTLGDICEDSNRDTRPKVDLIDLCSSDTSRTSTPSLPGGGVAADQDSPRQNFLSLPLPGQSQPENSETTLLYTQSNRESGISPPGSQEGNAAHTEPESVIPSDAGSSSINELNTVNASEALQPRPDEAHLTRPQSRGMLGEIDSDGTHLSPEEVRQRDIAMVATKSSKPDTLAPIFRRSPEAVSNLAREAVPPATPRTSMRKSSKSPSTHPLFPHDAHAQYEKELEVFERQCNERPAPAPTPSTFGPPTIGPPFSPQQSPQQLQRGKFPSWASVNGSQQPQPQTFHKYTASASAHVSANPFMIPNPPTVNRAHQMNISGSQSSPPLFQTIPYFPRVMPPTLNTMNVVHPPRPTFSAINAPQAITQRPTLQKPQFHPTNRSEPQEQRTPDHYVQNPNYRPLVNNKFPTGPSHHSNFQNINRSPVERIVPSSSHCNRAREIPIPQSILPEPQRYGTPMNGASRQQEPFCTMPSSAAQLSVITPQKQAPYTPTIQDPISHNAVRSTQSLPVLHQNEPHHNQLPRAGNVQSEDHAGQSRLFAPPSTPGRQQMSPQSISRPIFGSNQPDRPSYPPNFMTNTHFQAGEIRSNHHFSVKLASVQSNRAPVLHSFPTTTRNESFPSPPQSSSRRLRSTSPMQGKSNRVAQDPPLAHNPVTPSRSPSPVQLPAQDRRPYAMVPEGTSLSLEPDETPENQIAQRFRPAIRLSVDTTLIRCPEHGSDGSRLKLELFAQKANRTFDLNRPLSGKELEDSSLAQFFEKYSGHSGMPLTSLTTLTFQTSVGFKIQRQEFVVRRYGGEKAWDKFKKRLNHFMHDDPEETDFEVRVHWATP